MKTQTLAVLASLLMMRAEAQSVLFDFDNAPVYSPLPIDITVGGITALFSATGQGYSIQSSSTVTILPAGFSGHYIYPSSVYAADLLVSFSKTLTNFSILYSPQELGCDDSATMRVTAYLNSTFVGTATNTASAPGTWPSETLSITTAQGFNKVVVHYDAKPPTCQDWGPIFLADNMIVTPAPEPPISPTLQISWLTNQIQIGWLTNSTGFTLEQNSTLDTTNWISVTNAVSVVGINNQVVISPPTGQAFFRLFHP